MPHSFYLEISQATQVLNSGGVIIFPTDTVWGIGASLKSDIGIKKFYHIKNRDPKKPSQVLVSSLDQAYQLGVFNSNAKELTQKYWPGGLTLVVPANLELIPESVRFGKTTVGLRLPNDTLLQSIISSIGTGLVASSANFSEATPPLTFDQIDPKLLDLVDGIIDGQAGGKPSSTVVEIIDDKIKILRQGEVQIQ